MLNNYGFMTVMVAHKAKLDFKRGDYDGMRTGSWTSGTPANSYPRQDVPEIRDSLVLSLLGCLPSRTRDGSYPLQVVP